MRWSSRLAATLVIVSVLWDAKPYAVDLLAHFLPHVLILCALAWAVPLLRGPWARRAEGGAWVLALSALVLISYRPGHEPPEPGVRYERVVVAVYNTHTVFSEPKLAAWLDAEGVDLLGLVDPPYSIRRSDLAPESLKAHTLERAGGLWTGLAVASRWPFTPTPLVEKPHHTNVRSFLSHGAALVTTPAGARFFFAPMHPNSPRTEHSWAAARKEAWREAKRIAEARDALGLPWIIAGDFNATPTSRLWRDFARDTGLRSPAVPFTQGSWPAWAPRPLALPIDRVWASPGIRFGRVTVGPRLGSDHRPVAYELFVPVLPAPDETESDQ